MCGAGMDPNAQAAGGDADAKAARVRQRTMSQPSSELNEAVARIRAEETSEDTTLVEPVVPAIASSIASEAPVAAEELDPLSAYIEEVEEAPPVAASIEEAPKTERPAVEAMVAAPVQEVRAAQPSASMTSIPAAHIIVQKPAKVLPPQNPAATQNGSAHSPVASAASASATPSQKVIVESGMRKPGKGSNLSFGKNRPGNTESAAATPSTPPRAESRAPVETIDSNKTEKKSMRESDNQEVEARQTNERPASTQKAQSKPSKAPASSGRLFGWLVNYALDADGAATELREGKFFVTASSLKPTDLIIDDSSISTPHALVVVGTDTGLQVQDLMSDRGVFVRRRGADSYQREYEVVHVEHGDWVRFGDVEYLVSLIAHVGMK
jgi:hypothetical protein